MYCSKCGNQSEESGSFCKHCGAPVGAQVGSAPQVVSAAALATAEFLPASVGKRLGGWIIDTILVYITGAISTVLVALVAGTVLSFFVSIFWLIFYYLFFEGIWGRTPGKFATGTRVVMPDGSAASFGHILGRSFARYIPFEALSYLFSSHPRGWHDYLSGTLVVPQSYTPSDVQKINVEKLKSSVGAVIIIIIVGLFFSIAVIGLLSSVVLASLNSARGKGRDARRVADIKMLQLALELHFDAAGSYPATLSDLGTSEIPAVPVDPATGAPYDYYNCSANSYHLGATLESSTNTVLSKDSDAAAVCPADPINGSDNAPCEATETGVACFDVTQTI